MLRYLLQQVAHLFNPRFCAYCYTLLDEKMVFCDDCLNLVRPIINHQIPINRQQPMEIFSLSAYEEPLRSFIKAKNHGNFFAAQQLGSLMVKLLPSQAWEGDVLVPIPQHWKTYAKRGFNQSELIAQLLSTSLNKPLINAIQQIRAVQPHHRTERLTALDSIFRLGCNPNLLSNKRIILVDDLMATGATLSTAAQVVLSALPSSLHAVVACRKIW